MWDELLREEEEIQGATPTPGPAPSDNGPAPSNNGPAPSNNDDMLVATRIDTPEKATVVQATEPGVHLNISVVCFFL